MENITIGQIYNDLLFLGGFLGSVIVLVGYTKKMFAKVIDRAIKPLNEKIDILEQKIDSMEKEHMQKLSNIELESLKNDLINYMTLADKGIITPKTKEDMHKLFDEYTEYGGNSYIHDWWEKLKKEGKI